LDALHSLDDLFICLSALTAAGAVESAAGGFTAGTGVTSGNIDGGSGTVSGAVVRAALCLAVNLDFFKSLLVTDTVCCTAFRAFAEASAAGFVCMGGLVTHNLNVSAAAQGIFVIHTAHCRTIQNCHDKFLLFGCLIPEYSVFRHKDSMYE
jgi:hypothetical protein